MQARMGDFFFQDTVRQQDHISILFLKLYQYYEISSKKNRVVRVEASVVVYFDTAIPD
jgi:hypothetical protein